MISFAKLKITNNKHSQGDVSIAWLFDGCVKVHGDDDGDGDGGGGGGGGAGGGGGEDDGDGGSDDLLRQAQDHQQQALAERRQ